MSFPRYPKYKDSGVEWLGEVPEHWDVQRLGILFQQVSEPGEEGLPILSVSIHDGVSDKELNEEELDRKVSRSEDKEKYNKVLPGDLVYNMMRAWQGGFGCVSVEGMVSPAYVIARPNTSNMTAIIEQQLRTPNAIEEMRRHSQGVTDFRLRLYWDVFKTLRVTLPPLPEQQAIAAFLGRETAKIDALIAEQRRLIELLKEKRQAVISHAVTKGLNPSAPMKDSGIEWLGEVPKHWEVVSIKRALKRIEQGWSPECYNYSAGADEWGVVRAGCVNRGAFNESDNKALPSHLEPMPEYEIREGDVLTSRASGSPELVGSTALVGPCRSKLMLSDKTFRIHLNTNLVTAAFYVHALNSLLLRYQIERAISGAEGLANNLPQSSLREFQICLPPIEEQSGISNFLDHQLALSNTLTTQAEQSITLLQERRSALISAAVTGKIDVRGAVGTGDAA